MKIVCYANKAQNYYMQYWGCQKEKKCALRLARDGFGLSRCYIDNMLKKNIN